MVLRWPTEGQGLCPPSSKGGTPLRGDPPDPRDLEGKEGASRVEPKHPTFMPPPCLPNNGSPGGLPLVGVQGAKPLGLALGQRKPIKL
jgi:hypothetical protein